LGLVCEKFMIILFFRLLIVFFKWNRIIFVLILLEFLLMNVYFNFSLVFFSLFLFGLLIMRVVSRVLGLVVILYLVKGYGGDKVLF
jgi:hypothetical protein